MTDSSPLLHLEGIVKTFPGVVANDDVGFYIKPGEIHALLGENGAGKSTLVKMIYGVMRPDSGVMMMDGRPYAPGKPSDARKEGVGMVFQHFSLFDALTVAENIALGIDGAAVNAELKARTVEVSRSYGLQLDPDRVVGTLSVGERQRVEIVRCLLQNPRLLIMDEPTSVLTPQEIEILFRTLRQLSTEGCSILYISHKLEEIRALCDRATILRGGKVAGDCVPAEETAKSLAEMMLGASLAPAETAPMETGEVLLSVSGLTVRSDDPFGVSLEDISFTLRAGEILGIAGVAGNGQIELMEALIGERPLADPSIIRFNGAPIGKAGPTDRRRLGMCFIPEERLGHGAVPDMSLWENVLLTARNRKGLHRHGFIRAGAARAYSREVASRFDVRTAGVDHDARSLSGGNLQKFIVGREIMQNPSLLIVSQPTWGVDAGAAAELRNAIRALAAKGAAVLVISQDLDELMALSTCFAVLSEGRLSEPKRTGELSVEQIGLLMGEVHSGSGTGAATAKEATHASA